MGLQGRGDGSMEAARMLIWKLRLDRPQVRALRIGPMFRLDQQRRQGPPRKKRLRLRRSDTKRSPRP